MLREEVERIAALESENAALKAEIAGSKAKKRKVFCLYCDTEFSYDSADTNAQTELSRQMIAHDAVCEKNPLVAEIAKAKELIGILEDDQERDEKIIEELAIQCKCPECGCATVEDAESSECGCDAPVCALDVSKTLAEAYCEVLADIAALKARLEAVEKAAWVIVKRDIKVGAEDVDALCAVLQKGVPDGNPT